MITFIIRVRARARTQVLSSYILPSEKEEKNQVALCSAKYLFALKIQDKVFLCSTGTFRAEQFRY